MVVWTVPEAKVGQLLQGLQGRQQLRSACFTFKQRRACAASHLKMNNKKNDEVL